MNFNASASADLSTYCTRFLASAIFVLKLTMSIFLKMQITQVFNNK